MNGSVEYQKSDQTFLKQFNIRKILGILRQQGAVSRVDLAAISSLDKKTVTNIINLLLDTKQVRVVSRSTGGVGRPKEHLAINGDFCRAIGIDLGGTHISGVVVDYAGEALLSQNIDLNNDMEPETLLKLCYHTVDTLFNKTGLTPADISGIGISIPGTVDQETGASVLSENLPKWSNVPLRKLFEEKYGTDICVDDCTRLMALSELRYGVGSDCENFLVFDLGLGIGCGIVIGKAIYSGSSGKAGEVGHSIVKVDGPLCTCGRRGCIESLASGWALSLQAKEGIAAGTDTLLRDIVKNGTVSPTPKEITLAAELNDAFSISLLDKAGEYIGIGIANAISLYNPSKVVLGGRLIRDNALLLQRITETVRRLTIPVIYEETQIVESEMGLFASAVGAATLCLERFY